MTIAQTITVFFLLVFSSSPLAEACASSGVCGSSCGYQPPPVQCQPQSCQPGYSCGQVSNSTSISIHFILIDIMDDGVVVPVDVFVNSTLPKRNIFGVERRKESEAENKIDQATFAKLTNPNYLFRQCCEDRRLPDACLSKCHFNVFNKATLEAMFLKSDPCPIEAAADIQYCAAQGRDHRPCCHRNFIQSTAAGEKCLTFCDQRAGQVVKLDFSFLPCYDRFEFIKRCFYDDIKNRMEEKLSPRLEEKDG
ncbi:hypothetical protein M3Y96_00842100 [Aphelenchoides besseyi]|nr:hypothetical protein M3Y96_00842100 [Aphelenchoides besseyi]